MLDRLNLSFRLRLKIVLLGFNNQLLRLTRLARTGVNFLHCHSIALSVIVIAGIAIAMCEWSISFNEQKEVPLSSFPIMSDELIINKGITCSWTYNCDHSALGIHTIILSDSLLFLDDFETKCLDKTWWWHSMEDRTGHATAINGIIVSACEARYVLTGSQDCTVKRWGLDCKEMQSLERSIGTSFDDAFSPYGQPMGKIKSDSGLYTTNALDLHLDLLSVYPEVNLQFLIIDFNDESSPYDGLYFSDNGGRLFSDILSYHLHGLADKNISSPWSNVMGIQLISTNSSFPDIRSETRSISPENAVILYLAHGIPITEDQFFVDDQIKDSPVAVGLVANSELFAYPSSLHSDQDVSFRERESRVISWHFSGWLRWILSIIVITVTCCLLFRFHFKTTPLETKASIFTNVSMQLIIEARGQVALAQLDQALTKIEVSLEASNARIRNEICHLQFQYHDLQRQERLGIVAPAEATVQRNKIAYATLELLTFLERSIQVNPSLQRGLA